MKTYSFEKLDVWQLSRQLAVYVYKATKSFPDEEKFGLVSQMRRASISICSNIAEGNSKQSGKEKARYTENAHCSLMELLNQMIISSDLEYFLHEQVVELRQMIDEIAVKTSRLRAAQLKL